MISSSQHPVEHIVNIIALTNALEISSIECLKELNQRSAVATFFRYFDLSIVTDFENHNRSCNMLTMIKILNITESDEKKTSTANLAMRILGLTFFKFCSKRLREIAAPNILNIKQISKNTFDLSFKNQNSHIHEIDEKSLQNRALVLNMVDFITSGLMIDFKTYGITEIDASSLNKICIGEPRSSIWGTAWSTYITFVCIWKFKNDSPLATIPSDVIKIILNRLPNLKDQLIDLILNETAKCPSVRLRA